MLRVELLTMRVCMLNIYCAHGLIYRFTALVQVSLDMEIIELMKTLDILKDTDNPRKPYRIMKSEKEISLLARNYLPDLSEEMTTKQISDDYLHGRVADRWHATDGF